MKQLHITKTQEKLLTTIIHATTSSQALVRRATLVLAGGGTSSQRAIAQDMHTQRNTVHLWLVRWHESSSELKRLETEYAGNQLSEAAYQRSIATILADAPRPGAPPTITEEQKARIIALATDKPENAGVPVTHWSHELLAQAVVEKGIVESISSSHIGRFLKAGHTSTTPQ